MSEPNYRGGDHSQGYGDRAICRLFLSKHVCGFHLDGDEHVSSLFGHTHDFAMSIRVHGDDCEAVLDRSKDPTS